MMVGVCSGVWGEEIKIYTEKYENGQVIVKGNLVDGKQEGKWVIYDENGKMKKEENLVSLLAILLIQLHYLKNMEQMQHDFQLC